MTHHHPLCPTPDDPPDDEHQAPEEFDDWTDSFYADQPLLQEPSDATPTRPGSPTGNGCPAPTSH